MVMLRIKITTKHLAIIVFSMMGCVVVHYFYELRRIEKEGIYSIGFVTDYQYRSRTSYHFYYKGIKYNDGYTIGIFTTKDIGKRFFVQFLKDDPDKCVLFHKKVPDYLTEAPPEGWETIPKRVDEKLKTIKKEGIRSIGFLTDYRYLAQTPVWHYHFYYKGIKYNGGNMDGVFTTKDIGKRFFVQFLKDTPHKCVLLREKVPDCLTEAPPEGWVTVPECTGENENVY